MTKAKGMTIAELNAEVARLEAEQAEEAQQELLRADTARTRYYTDLLGCGQALDEALELEGRAGEADAVAAMTAGDLNGAFASWCAWQRTRVVRATIRSRVQSGANVTGLKAWTEADLNQARGTFADWLGGQEHLHIEVGVALRVAELAGTIPGEED